MITVQGRMVLARKDSVADAGGSAKLTGLCRRIGTPFPVTLSVQNNPALAGDITR